MNYKKHLLTFSSLFLFIPLMGCNTTKEHTVTFDCTDIKESIPTQKVKNNNKAVKPDITITPKEDSKLFDNYYLNGVVFDFNTPITMDITINVKVTDKVHTVTFDYSDIKETIPVQKINHNEQAIKPEITITPKEETKKFVGYYIDGKEYNFDNPVTRDLTIKCLVDDNYHTITFDPGDGTLPESSKKVNVLNSKTLLDVLPEGKLPIPEAPTGEHFINWVDEDDKEFEASAKIYKDYALKAKYTANWIDISTNDRNLDASSGASKLTAKINNVTVTDQCTFSVVKGYENLIKIENGYIKPADDIATSGMAIVKADADYNDAPYVGYYLISVGSFNKMHLASLVKGEAVSKDTLIEGTVLIPNYYFVYSSNEFVSINSIGNDGFKDCTKVTSIYMPNNITDIGLLGFTNCTILKEIKLSDSLTNIGQLAFFGCSSLESITIPETCENIESYAFYGCDKLESAKFIDPNYWMFSEDNIGVDRELLANESDAAKALKNLYTEDVLKKVKDSDPLLNASEIFLEMNDSYTLTFPIFANQSVTYRSEDDSIAKVEDDVIIPLKPGETKIYATNAYGKSACVNVCVANRTTYCNVDGYVAVNWEYISYGVVRLPSKIDDIEITGVSPLGFDRADSYMVYIPDSYTTIGTMAFQLSHLQYIRFGINSKLTSIEANAFVNCNNLSYINLPDSLEYIGPRAFQSCTRLTHIHLPVNDKFNSISSYMFDKSNLADIVIPKNVKEIKDNAFSNCTNLKKIYYTGTVKEFSSCIGTHTNVFANVPATTVRCVDGEYTIVK